MTSSVVFYYTDELQEIHTIVRFGPFPFTPIMKNRSAKHTQFLTFSWLRLDKTALSVLGKNKPLPEENYRIVRRNEKIEGGALRPKTLVARKPEQKPLGRSLSPLSRNISQPSSAISLTLEKAMVNPESYHIPSKTNFLLMKNGKKTILIYFWTEPRVLRRVLTPLMRQTNRKPLMTLLKILEGWLWCGMNSARCYQAQIACGFHCRNRP